MNTIKKLNTQIDEAKVILDNYYSILTDDPDNVAYKLSAKTVEKHIADLQSQIKIEKKLRDKEIVELRLKGRLAQYGSVPLAILGDIAKELSNAINAASQRIKVGGEPVGRIPSNTIKTINLRLAGLETGSTRLFITGDTAPDIFGFSLIEESLLGTFKLLNSDSPDELIDSVSKVGSRCVRNINKFVKKLSSSDLEAEIKWSSPTEDQYKWDGTKERLKFVSNSLESISSPPPEYIAVTGEIITISQRGLFEIQKKGGTIYKGTFPSKLLDEVKKLHIGDIIKCNIEKKTIINDTTGYQKKYFTLMSFRSKEGANGKRKS